VDGCASECHGRQPQLPWLEQHLLELATGPRQAEQTSTGAIETLNEQGPGSWLDRHRVACLDLLRGLAAVGRNLVHLSRLDEVEGLAVRGARQGIQARALDSQVGVLQAGDAIFEDGKPQTACTARTRGERQPILAQPDGRHGRLLAAIQEQREPLLAQAGHHQPVSARYFGWHQQAAVRQLQGMGDCCCLAPQHGPGKALDRDRGSRTAAVQRGVETQHDHGAIDLVEVEPVLSVHVHAI
jgi:hypothetical protein